MTMLSAFRKSSVKVAISLGLGVLLWGAVSVCLADTARGMVEILAVMQDPVESAGSVLKAIVALVGAGLFFSGILKYLEYRQNREDGSLQKPITLWITGLALLAVGLFHFAM